MINKLVKEYSFETVIPNSYQEFLPGYSYFKDASQAALTSSGQTYVASVLSNRGYKVSPSDLIVSGTTSSYIFGISYRTTSGYDIDPSTGNEVYKPIGWYIQFGYIPLKIGGYSIPESIHTTVNRYFDTPPTGGTVNVPGSWTTVTPEPYEQKVPIVGWNGGAISSGMFTSTGTASFSIGYKSVGAFTGLCEQNIAIQDQRYERIKYAIYTHLGIYSVYIDNVKKTVDSSFVEEDVFKIVVSKTLVAFYKNDLLIYSETKIDNNTVYVLDCSMYYSNDSILNASIDVSTTLDSYSSASGTLTYVGDGISYNYSIGQGELSYTSVGSNLVEVEFTQEYSGIGISYNYSIGIGLQEYTGQSYNYPSRIEGTLTYTGFGISKNHSVGQGNLAYIGLGEAGGIIPTVPPIGLGYMVYTGFSRNVYILPPQIFVNS